MLNLIKLSVGTRDVAGLRGFQQRRLRDEARLYHRTRMFPRRVGELLDGGSIYWVIGGFVGIAMPLLPRVGLGVAAAVLTAWAFFVLASRPHRPRPAPTPTKKL